MALVVVVGPTEPPRPLPDNMFTRSELHSRTQNWLLLLNEAYASANRNDSAAKGQITSDLPVGARSIGPEP